MKKAWQKTDMQEALPVPKRPEPPQPTIKEDTTPIQTIRMPSAKVVELPQYEMPLPERPIELPPAVADIPSFKFMFHKLYCTILSICPQVFLAYLFTKKDTPVRVSF